MTDTDKIVAAILAGVKCSAGRDHDPETYLQTYDEFREKIAAREKAKRKMPPISDETLARARR